MIRRSAGTYVSDGRDPSDKRNREKGTTKVWRRRRLDVRRGGSEGEGGVREGNVFLLIRRFLSLQQAAVPFLVAVSFSTYVRTGRTTEPAR